MIKDSGERTQFESGAVRDMHEGKGRFDLKTKQKLYDPMSKKHKKRLHKVKRQITRL